MCSEQQPLSSPARSRGCRGLGAAQPPWDARPTAAELRPKGGAQASSHLVPPVSTEGLVLLAKRAHLSATKDLTLNRPTRKEDEPDAVRAPCLLALGSPPAEVRFVCGICGSLAGPWNGICYPVLAEEASPLAGKGLSPMSQFPPKVTKLIP